MAKTKESKTALGIDENIEGLLCYVLLFVTGFIFLLIEKKSRFVRFHAMQSLIAFLALFVISAVAGIVPLFGRVVSSLLGILTFVLWIFMMYKAYNNELYKLPIAGDFAEKQSEK